MIEGVDSGWVNEQLPGKQGGQIVCSNCWVIFSFNN